MPRHMGGGGEGGAHKHTNTTIPTPCSPDAIWVHVTPLPTEKKPTFFYIDLCVF